MKQPNTIFITGASSGLGAAIARRFAAGGAKVVVAARRVGKLDDLVSEIGPCVTQTCSAEDLCLQRPIDRARPIGSEGTRQRIHGVGAELNRLGFSRRCATMQRTWVACV